jgi:hypothetical protein
MNKFNKNIKNLLIFAGVIMLIGLYIYIQQSPGKLDVFAKCLSEKGAKFYGAFWCSHCQNQKKSFGKSQKFVPYIECSTPDGNGQYKECQDKNIQSYPTWEFGDGTREEGEVSLSKLAEKSGCSIP